jgi:hypothetical protein
MSGPKRLASALLLGAWLVTVCCTSEGDKEKAAELSPKAQLLSILNQTGTQCKAPSGCASQICSMDFCVTLPSATQVWMEERIAGRVNELLAADPTLNSVLREQLGKLAEEDRYIQSRIAGFLGALGHSDFIEMLLKLSREEVELVRTRAVVALGRMGHPATFPELLVLLSHPSRPLALLAMDAMVSYTKLPASREPALDALLLQLTAEDHYKRLRAILALKASGIQNDRVVTGLSALIQQPGNGFLRYDAFDALVSLAPERFELAAALLRTVESQ